ncbi:MAG TPA: RecX family transcriptional regulator [Solirubrobacterales bacterium]|nr:RecX family transcriptional regulator [Solirubrobacterales bacterium]
MARDADAFELALRALGRKERSSAELAEWLRERGAEEDEVEVAIGRLTEIGELDDERFAVRYAQDKRELAGWGAERIREALLERGIAPEHVEAAVCSDSEEIQVRRATDLLARRDRGLGSDADRASALGYLTRRGYSYEVAHEAIRSARAE